jgi:hypothetical protein
MAVVSPTNGTSTRIFLGAGGWISMTLMLRGVRGSGQG